MALDAKRKRIAKMIAVLQRKLDLSDWCFVISAEPPKGEGRYAEVSVLYASRVATICVSDAMAGMPREAVTYVLAHELMHVHLWQLGELHDRAISSLGVKARTVADEHYVDTEERIVDALALAITCMIHGPGAREKAVSAIVSA